MCSLSESRASVSPGTTNDADCTDGRTPRSNGAATLQKAERSAVRVFSSASPERMYGAFHLGVPLTIRAHLSWSSAALSGETYSPPHSSFLRRSIHSSATARLGANAPMFLTLAERILLLHSPLP